MTKAEYLAHLTACYITANGADAENANAWQKPVHVQRHCHHIQSIVRDILTEREYKDWLDYVCGETSPKGVVGKAHDLIHKKWDVSFAPRPEDYRGIYHWGKHLASFDYYIQNQQRKACKDGAPIDAIYYQDAPRFDRKAGWVCVSDLEPDHSFVAYFNKQEGVNND